MMPADLVSNPPRPIREAFEEVASMTGVPFHQIIGPDQNKRVSHARQLGMFIARERGATLQQIGNILGRYHTTVMYGIRAEKARRAAQ
jgi:chromosomal replication initiation ATPase DnaA